MSKHDLPDGWVWVKFGDVAKQINDTVDPETSDLERYVAGGHMDTDDLKIRRWGVVGDGYLGPAFHRKFQKGHILYGSRRTYLRKVAVADFDGICANTTFVIEARPSKIHPPLLPFIMQSEPFVAHSINNSRGSTNPYVNWKDIAKYEFALPPLDEQRRIAEVLTAQETTNENWRKCLSEMKKAKSVIMRHLFDQEVKDTISLSEVGTWMSGGTPSRQNENYWSGLIPWASPKDMKTDVLHDTEEHISEEGATSGTRTVPKDTIFIVIRGMILAHTFPVAIAGREMAFNQDMKALITNEKFLPKYVFYWLKNNSKRILHITSESSHGTKRLPTDEIFSIKIPYLSPGEQLQIVERLEQIDEKDKLIQSHLKKLSILKRSLLSNFLYFNSRA